MGLNSPMWMVVGLGNPGREYAKTRHNIGFMVLDHWVQAGSSLVGSGQWQSQFKAEVIKTRLERQDLLLLKPQTFMNLSGESVVAARGFYKVEPQNIIVVHDEVDLPFSQMRIQFERGHGGHNGIRSIHGLLGTNAYYRVRMGIGKPPQPGPPMVDHVLGAFSKEEFAELPEFLSRAIEGISTLIQEGYPKASSLFNK